MKIILLSGGSGKRLWPLSNDARSKQFLRLLTAPDGTKESMIQRVVRQIKTAGLSDDIVVATGINQKDSIENQLGNTLSVVTEPCRRDTFPAIVLACSYLASKGTSMDEPVIVMPCDSYTEDTYFSIIAKMSEAVAGAAADLVLMGITPMYPSAKYGYIVPDKGTMADGLMAVKRFTEKPDIHTAENLIKEGALWNGGVFAFRLGYLMKITETLMSGMDFAGLRESYTDLPKISFDYEVVEKAQSVAVISYSGQWKDLGTWNTLTDELKERCIGNVVMDDQSENTHVVNELEIPVMCIGVRNMVIAASCDGILVSDKAQSENIKHYADSLQHRPMYEERCWGEYKVIDNICFEDGHQALTKHLTIKTGKNISYQVHRFRDEVWTFVGGNGILVIDGKVSNVKQGDVIYIRKGTKHAVKAITDLHFIEVQSGTKLIEEDIERYDWNWNR